MQDKISCLSKQIRAARGLLGWSRNELSGHSGVSMATLAEIETADQQKQVDKDGTARERRTFGARTIRDIQTALEAAGVEFLDGGQAAAAGGAGVRLKSAASGALQSGD